MLNLDDNLMWLVKKRAAESGRTVTAVIEEALREAIASPARAKGKFRLQWVSVRGRLRPIALFAKCARQADARGNLAFDAQIAALCLEHGVGEILTLDRDFTRFPGLKILDLD